MGAKVSSGGSSKRGSYSANADMNVIPFIDILLVLLIIFMVAAPPPTTDVKVDLPPPNPIPTITNKRPTLVDIRNKGGGEMQIFVDSELVTNTDQLFDTVFKHVSMNVPGTSNPLLETVKVRADQTLAYGDVMGIMAILQVKLFTNVSLVAEDAISESAAAQ